MPFLLGTTRKSANSFPLFRPHPLLRSGHAQTVAANYLAGAPRRRSAQRSHRVPVSEGDQIVLHDDQPDNWGPGDPTTLLLHGLGGSHRSAYLYRAARKLNAQGVRTFRMDYRTCGAGRNLARRAYHAGQSDDALAALQFISRTCHLSPLNLVGYSMGGNLALKTLGEHASNLPEHIARAVVVNPAIDLAACCNFLTGPVQRLYDRHFAKSLIAHLARHSELAHEATVLAEFPKMRIRDFDERFTVPHWGFETVDDYYRNASSAPFLSRIKVPTLILHSQDDPLIPSGIFYSLEASDSVAVHLSSHGGHLGFIGASGVDADRRWMDWRIVDWLTGRVDIRDVQATARPKFWRRFAARGQSRQARQTPQEIISIAK